MKTLKPLRQLLPEIMTHIQLHNPNLLYNMRLLLVHEGQLRKEIEDSLALELSPDALKRVLPRIPSINVLVRIIDKLSRVYADPAIRTVPAKADEGLLRFYEKALDLDNTLPTANRMFNLHKSCALEPFIVEGKPRLRVLPASKFLVFSDSKIDPLTPTVFIKLIGRELKVPFTDRDGRKTDVKEPYEVDLYILYSDDEIIVVDSDCDVRADRMSEYAIDGTNPIGRIPFVYINKSDFLLTPLPDTDTLGNTVLIPKLLADLNYAVQFQSHSVMVATDLTIPENVAWNPDVMISMKTDEDKTHQGTVQTIKPEVNIEGVIKLIESTLSLWLEARNIKSSPVGKVTAQTASSGVAKIIDESDATQDRRSQMSVFGRVEDCLWSLVPLLHNYWCESGQLAHPERFSETFGVGVQFANVQPMQTEAQEIAAVKELLELGLTDKWNALQRLNPHMGPDEVDALLESVGGSDLSLNPLELQWLVAIITACAAGQLPRDTAIGTIIQAFSIDEEAAEQIVGSAGMTPKDEAQESAENEPIPEGPNGLDSGGGQAADPKAGG